MPSQILYPDDPALQTSLPKKRLLLVDEASIAESDKCASKAKYRIKRSKSYFCWPVPCTAINSGEDQLACPSLSTGGSIGD